MKKFFYLHQFIVLLILFHLYFSRTIRLFGDFFEQRCFFNRNININIPILSAIYTGLNNDIYFYIARFFIFLFSYFFKNNLLQVEGFFEDEGESEKIIILGAGAAGSQIFEQLKSTPSLKINPIGFLDDSQESQNRTVSGAPVLGTK